MRNKISYIFTLLLFCYSCGENAKKGVLTRVKNIPKNSVVVSNKSLDSLKNVVMKIRSAIYKTSDAPKSTLDENFDLLDHYLFAFVSLEAIHRDSVQIHAPVTSVNKVVDEYNLFVRENLVDDFELIQKFNDVSEYKTKKNEYLSLILRNEIKLHKKHGYYLNKKGEVMHDRP
jgi:hypothetical protein